MLLTDDQMKMFSNEPDVFRSISRTKWLWTKHWNEIERKYLIPFTDHPVPAAQESFCFELVFSEFEKACSLHSNKLLNENEKG